MAASFREDFKRFFTRGLAAALPTLLTLSVFLWLFTKLNDYIGKYINIGLYWVIGKVWLAVRDPAVPRPAVEAEIEAFGETWLQWYWWVGFALAFVAIYIFGRFVGSFIGRAAWRTVESGFRKLPLVKQVYPSIKQVTDFLLSEREFEVSRVVAVEYPSKGIWSLGLVTSSGLRGVADRVGEEMLAIFIPSSPTPFTGYTITVKRESVVDLPISIDEALRFTISGGVILPGGQELSERELEQLRQGDCLLAQQKEAGSEHHC